MGTRTISSLRFRSRTRGESPGPRSPLSVARLVVYGCGTRADSSSYPAAITDARASLAHKKTLYPPESEVLAEAHFKLSLALEYASITTTEEAAAGSGVGSESVVDQAQRDEACEELRAAIESTRLKMEKKEVELAATAAPEEGVTLREEIGELKEIIGDMEERVSLPASLILVPYLSAPLLPLYPFLRFFAFGLFLTLDSLHFFISGFGLVFGFFFWIEADGVGVQLKDLRGPPIDINETLYGAKGLLGAASGASAAKMQDAKKNATDLSSLVRKKGKESKEGGSEENGKRKAEGEASEQGEGSKKAKVEDA